MRPLSGVEQVQRPHVTCVMKGATGEGRLSQVKWVIERRKNRVELSGRVRLN